MSILFYSDVLQHGFKKNLSCANAIFVLSETAQYFIKHGSEVFMAFLDAK